MRILNTSGDLLLEFDGDLRSRDLSGAQLPDAMLQGADLSGVNLSGANLERANLGGANLSGANLTAASLRFTICTGATFDRAVLTDTDLYWACAPSTSFRGAHLERTLCRGTGFEDASFANALLVDVVLTRDDLGGSANIQGADFTGATLSRVQLHGAEYDENTLFPSGFDPEGEGLTRVSG